MFRRFNDEIEKGLSCLRDGGVILYPTDTVWGIGCDATDENTVSKIFDIKRRSESKSLVILVDSIEMLQQYISTIPSKAVELVKRAKKPTSVIYNNPKGLAKNVIAADNTVAIRIAKDKFCQQLIRQFGKPIVSTSANISGEPTPTSFKEIDTTILEAVDYVVNLRQDEVSKQSSRILRILKDGTIQTLRD